MPTTKNQPAPRFTLTDTQATVAHHMVRNSSISPRYWVMDTETNTAYDAFTTKREASETVRDLNHGLYGPLAEEA